MDTRKTVIGTFIAVVFGLMLVFVQHLYGLYSEYQKFREIEISTSKRTKVLPEPSVKVTPVDIEAININRAARPTSTSGVDQCEYVRQFHQCLQTSTTKSSIDVGSTNFNFVIDSCRTAAKDLAIRAVEVIPESCRGE